MNTNCAECRRPCPEHSILACATCHKHPGECEFGDCQRRASYALTHESGREMRRFCRKHATAPHYGFARAGYAVTQLSSLAT